MLNRSSHRRQGGLTLIELMIAAAIIAILAGLAWNFFDQQSAKNRRTDAIIALTKARLAMQQWKSDFGAYNGNGNAAGTAALDVYRRNAPGSAPLSQATACQQNRGYMGAGVNFTSCRGYYNITLDAVDFGAETFTLRATDTGVFDGTRQEDARCKIFTLSNTGIRGVDLTGVGTGLTGTETLVDRTRECWSQ